uniref:PDZ domain-containing protein n=1 Tax=Peronospora matthiolae TaxID=2874970 RepID=A0AAV1THZ5_9STRA
MSHEELLAHQLDLHHKIQQQMQMQMEMSMQLGARQSLAKVEPDLGDNVFDMLDDLIMIPSGAIASTERGSLSKKAGGGGSGDEDDEDGAMGADPDASDKRMSSSMGSGSVSSSRDSLADILESLDMDLDVDDDRDRDDDNDDTLSCGSGRSKTSGGGGSSGTLDEADLDDLRHELDNLDLDSDVHYGSDQGGSMMDKGDEMNERAPPAAEEEFVHLRRSSLDLLASMRSSTAGMMTHNATGNMCTLVWEGGLLGLRLRHSQSQLVPAVSKIMGKSSIFGIHLVDVGDLLLQIGHRNTQEMEFDEAIQYLKEVAKPCQLVFRRLMADPMAVKPVQPKVTSTIGLKLAAKFEELTAAENEKYPPQPAVKLESKYEIKWLDGPLGISLIASKDIPYPLVTRITGKNRSPQVQDVQPGHYLVQIGNYSTTDGNFNTAIKFLQKVQKPVSLFFCPGNKKVSSRPDPADDEYDHIWEKKQPLCFTVRPSAAGHMVVADLGSAKSIKVKIKGAPNNVAAFVSSGDRIVWINDESVRDLTFHESLLKLRTAKRPLVIRFKKGSPENAIAGLTSASIHSASKFTASTSSLASSSTSVSSSISSASSSVSLSSTLSSTARESETPAAETSPPKAVQPPAVPPPPRSFMNPLKKMSIALGSHSKENAHTVSSAKMANEHRKYQDRQAHPPPSQQVQHQQQQVQHQQHQQVQRQHQQVQHQQHSSQLHPHAAPEVSQSRYRGHADQEAKRSAHDVRQPNASSCNAPRISPHGSRGGGGYHTTGPDVPATKDPSPRSTPGLDHTSGIRNDTHQRTADTHNKARNLEQGLRKSPLAKSSNDPIDNDTPLKPLSQGDHHPGSLLHVLSSEASSSMEKELAMDNDVYEVVWPEGTALGLTLRVHPTTRFPVVARVTGTSNLKNIEHVSPGDILFAANNMNIVPQPKFKQTLENLSRLPKPAVLRFRRSSAAAYAAVRAEETDQTLLRGPPLKDREYELIWRENANLGLVFSSDADVPKVTKVDMDSGGPMLHKVSVGDVLTWIGPMEISGSSFHSSMATLRAVKRPVVLRFYKRRT